MLTKEELTRSLIEYAADDYDSSDPKQVSFVEWTIEDAIDEVVNRMYPWGFKTNDEKAKVVQMALRKYGFKIRKVAEINYDRQGKQGVSTFYESGQTTSFESIEKYLQDIVSIARVV